MSAGQSSHAGTLPSALLALIADRPYSLVWRNELGGLTFEVRAGSGREFIKWTPASSGVDFDREIARLAWARSFVTVPRVLQHGGDDDGAWMVTAGLTADNAVNARWVADPTSAVTAIGEGLRALHDALPVSECPFSWSTEARIADAHHRAAQRHLDPAGWHRDHRGLGVPAALQIIDAPPAIDQLVVCHGDACAPNTLIGDNGHWTAHVDLGSRGTADRWADLAVATWSTQWNYGAGWEQLLLDAYGTDPDPGRSAYYRLLWDLGP